MTAAERIAGVVGGVVRQALLDADAHVVVILDDGSPEATLAHDWCAAALGANFVARARGVALPRAVTEIIAERLSARDIPSLDAAMLADESRRLEARLLGQGAGKALLAHPANKTALLLGPSAPPEPLLPLGDLYATDVRALAGDWSVPPSVRALTDVAGGIELLDDALRAHFDERRPLEEAVARLPEQARSPVAEAIERGRFARLRMGLVPKLGPRTLGVDLFG